MNNDKKHNDKKPGTADEQQSPGEWSFSCLLTAGFNRIGIQRIILEELQQVFAVFIG